MRMIRIAAPALAAAGATALLAPALAGAHATVSAIQPQGASLTSARQAYVVRAPNETANLFTDRVSLTVPGAVQEGISVLKEPGWKVRLKRVATGKTDEDGAPVMKTTRITWTAKAGSAFGPGFFGEWRIRFQNPATAQKLCFPIVQHYRGKRVKGRKTKTETVRWVGPEGSEFPASCINVVAG
jgi:hypothetical protein